MARSLTPLRRPDTRNVGFIQHVPLALRDRIDGLEVYVPIGDAQVRCRFARHRSAVRLSLRTSHPAEAKKRHAALTAYFAQLWASLAANEPKSLTHRQCVALAGEFFHAWIADSATAARVLLRTEGKHDALWAVSEAPVLSSALWRAGGEHLTTASGFAAGATLEDTFGTVIDHALWDRGITALAPATRAMLLREFPAALRAAFEVQARQSVGDYSPPPEAARFPEWERPKASTTSCATNAGRGAAKVSLVGLVDKWWAEAEAAGRSRSTHGSYKSGVHRLAAFLQHDDAGAITTADVLRFKDHRIAAGIRRAQYWTVI